MFCVNCGGKLPENGNFCVQCGSRAAAPPAHAGAVPAGPSPVPPPDSPRYAPVPSGPPIGPSRAIMATPVGHAAPPVDYAPVGHGAAKCAWCGETFDGAQSTCPKCGATVSQSSVVSRSGWAKLPGRKDMAKLQFGNSVCQIEGNYVPVADLKLAPEDNVYFTHHVLLWKDPQVAVTAMSLKGGWKRMLGGLLLIMTQAQGPGHIAFSQDSPGELIAMPLQHGQSIDVREHLFLAATGNVQYDWFQTNIWFTTRNGNETETFYPMGRVMDRFQASQGPGLLLLHAAGNVFIRQLAPGQTILVKPTAIVFKDPTVHMQLHVERPGSVMGAFFSTSTSYLWLRLSGPGRVAIQSVFDRVEGEQSNVTGLSRSSAGSMFGGDGLGEMIGGLIEGIDFN